MVNSNIGVIINFCSNEKPFIHSLLSQCSIFSSNIVVSYGSHMYDGSPEELNEYIAYLKFKYPFVKFMEYKVDLTIPQTELRGVVKRPTAYWCNLARWQGIEYLRDNGIKWILFLDADEIPQGDSMKTWINENMLDERYVYKFANYWYFKLPIYQATQFEDSILLANVKHLTLDTVFHDDERDGIIKVSNALQSRMVMGATPIFHHFSWVRTKEGIAKKLGTWAHRDDLFKGADINSVVEYMYKNENVNDFVHNYNYVIVSNIFNINI